MSNNTNKSNKKKLVIILVVVLIALVILLLMLFGKKTQYNVHFDSNGGTVIESIIVDENGYAVKPQDPVRENYVFAGWYLDGKPFDFSTPITADMKLEARWVEIGRVSGVTLDKDTLALKIGDKVKLNATVTPENAADKTVTWKSSNPEVARVDANGNVEALKEGTATITVTTKDGEFVASVVVNVTSLEPDKDVVDDNKEDKDTTTKDEDSEQVTPTEVKVTGVSLNKTKLSLAVNESEKLTATVKPSNATDKGVTWKSSNPEVASVDANGNVKALKEGTVTITVTTNDGKYTASCTVTVTAKDDTVKVTGVSLNKTKLSLYVNESEKLTATVKPSNATDKSVTWKSSNSAVATVDANGNVKALKEGTATITVTTKDGKYTASCTVTVTKKVENYVVTLTAMPLYEGGPIVQYSVAVTKNGSPCDYRFVIYNGEKLGKYPDAGKFETRKTTATVRLTDGTDVTATVVFN